MAVTQQEAKETVLQAQAVMQQEGKETVRQVAKLMEDKEAKDKATLVKVQQAETLQEDRIMHPAELEA